MKQPNAQSAEACNILEYMAHTLSRAHCYALDLTQTAWCPIALDKDPFVNAGRIRVGVRGSTVRLTGLVPSEAERDIAERDTWYVFGVDRVMNEIRVGN